MYYSWAIFESNELVCFSADGTPKQGKWSRYRKVFDMPWDECSSLASDLSEIVRVVMDYEKEYDTSQSFGQPGSDWRIRCIRGTDWNDDRNPVCKPHPGNNTACGA